METIEKLLDYGITEVELLEHLLLWLPTSTTEEAIEDFLTDNDIDIEDLF